MITKILQLQYYNSNSKKDGLKDITNVIIQVRYWNIPATTKIFCASSE